MQWTLTSSWTFVVEEETVYSKYVISLPVVDDDPVRIKLCSPCGKKRDKEIGK